jgi:hypothetical protein
VLDTTGRPPCRQCRLPNMRLFARHLCKKCARDPAIRALHPLAPQTPHRFDTTDVPRPPDEPTDALPGSIQKKLVMAARYEARRAIFHPGDATLPPD